MTRGRAPASDRGLPASAILGLGLLAAIISLVLLFVPFFGAPGAAAILVREQMVLRLDGHGPGILHLWLHHGYIPTIVLLVLLVLAALPWRAALVLQRAPFAEVKDPATQTRRSGPGQSLSTLVFADDGSLEDRTHPGAWRILRSTQELQVMARDARIPWRAEYGTAGGARALLEILRVVSEASAAGRREDDRHAPAPPGRDMPPTEEGAAPRPAEPGGPAEPAQALGTDPLDGAGAPGGGAPQEDPAGYRPSSSSWTPGRSGTVYTSTELYTSDRLEGTADDDVPSTDDGDRTGEGT